MSVRKAILAAAVASFVGLPIAAQAGERAAASSLKASAPAGTSLSAMRASSAVQKKNREFAPETLLYVILGLGGAVLLIDELSSDNKSRGA